MSFVGLAQMLILGSQLLIGDERFFLMFPVRLHRVLGVV
jgi:hypothetical protein